MLTLMKKLISCKKFLNLNLSKFIVTNVSMKEKLGSN